FTTNAEFVHFDLTTELLDVAGDRVLIPAHGTEGFDAHLHPLACNELELLAVEVDEVTLRLVVHLNDLTTEFAHALQLFTKAFNGEIFQHTLNRRVRVIQIHVHGIQDSRHFE